MQSEGDVKGQGDAMVLALKIEGGGHKPENVGTPRSWKMHRNELSPGASKK